MWYKMLEAILIVAIFCGREFYKVYLIEKICFQFKESIMTNNISVNHLHVKAAMYYLRDRLKKKKWLIETEKENILDTIEERLHLIVSNINAKRLLDLKEFCQ